MVIVVNEDKLSSVLSEFARTLITDFPIQGILDHLVERIVEVLPVTSTGVTLISPGMAPRYIAASDEAALRFEKLQTEIGQGPCLVAYESGEAVSIPDLGADDRFPQFAPAARGGRAGRGVHVPAPPRRRSPRRARSVPRHARRSRPARHGRGADVGGCRGGLPAQRPGPRRGPRHVRAVPPQRAPRSADRAGEPAPAAGATRARRRASQALAHQRSHPVRRPRPFQAGQRHPRPSGRRRVARRRRPPAVESGPLG